MQAHRLYGPGPQEPEPLEPVPDLAGTPVDDVDGRFAGTVHGSLIEADSGMIRYLDVALADGDRHVLVPLGHTRVEPERGRPRVRLIAASRDELGQIPEYHAGKPVDREFGRAVTRAHGRVFHGERYYAHPAYDHHGLFAGEHPIVRGPVPRPGAGPLERLAELPEYTVADEERDARGWPVRAGGRRVGTIADLVVDPEEGKARYAIIQLADDGRQVLVPIGYLRIRPDAETVDLPALRVDDLQALPPYEGGPITRSMEKHVRAILSDRLDGDGRHFDGPDYAPAGRPARTARRASD